jgi:hypothetical protein
MSGSGSVGANGAELFGVGEERRRPGGSQSGVVTLT